MGGLNRMHRPAETLPDLWEGVESFLRVSTKMAKSMNRKPDEFFCQEHKELIEQFFPNGWKKIEENYETSKSE